MAEFDQAEALLAAFKGDQYLHGLDVLSGVGRAAAAHGRRAALVHSTFPGIERWLPAIRDSLSAAGVRVLGEIKGARPNAPRADLARIAAGLDALGPDLLVTFGGGSTIDAAKAAGVLHVLGGDIESYFGTGLVSQALAHSGKALAPHVAIQTAASSGAHLTKYANITDLTTGQKKLIVDEAIVPVAPVFDYGVTAGAPPDLTADGAMDAMAHALEVLYGAAGKPSYDRIAQVAGECIRLALGHLPGALADPHDTRARMALGLATDLGGYAIMLGGTNGGHLTSFSLVDILSHGRACALLNPYYTVLFAPAIQDPLRLVGGLYQEAGYARADIRTLTGRDLALAVAEAMIAFERDAGLPTALDQVPGFTAGHIHRALVAAKDPQLRMKLENMPIPLTEGMIDEYIGSVLKAARMGDLALVKDVP